MLWYWLHLRQRNRFKIQYQRLFVIDVSAKIGLSWNVGEFIVVTRLDVRKGYNVFFWEAAGINTEEPRSNSVIIITNEF